jgi:hypothetical protein
MSWDLPLPFYQQPSAMTANGGSSQWRNAPDVAAVASDFTIIADGTVVRGSGTSGSSPLWAAFSALVNQHAAENQLPPLGFANPAIYAIGASPGYGAAFHDIADYSSDKLGSDATTYQAGPGYDLCTGWGSPNGMALILALNSQASAQGSSGILVAPDAPFVTFPNPFRPSLGGLMSLKFAPTTQGLSLEVFDVAYRRIYSGALDPGQASLGKGIYPGVDGEGHALAPGTYFAVLKGASSVRRCKFTVMP